MGRGEHSHTEHRRSGGQSLRLALLLTGSFCLVEIVAGWATNSLALIADAAHMLTDVAALSLSLFALKISARPATHQKTYGYLRAEILAALVNGIFLVLVSMYIFYEAYFRLFSPPEVKSGPMLIVAVLGLAANLATASILFKSQHDNLNIRGAFLHVMGDTLGSLGAISAGVVMTVWHWYSADAVASIIVGILILYGSWQLVRESADVLLEATPRHLVISEILADLGSVEGVVSVHDLHVWSITSGMPALSCHVVLRRGADSARTLSAVSRVIRERHGIEHTTIQIEVEDYVMPQHPSCPLGGPAGH
jgi:cobalt-zinc-cadmium efflux system protein